MSFIDFTNKRPVFFSALAFCLGIFLAHYAKVPFALSVCLAAGTAALLILFFILKINRLRGTLALVLIVCGAIMSYSFSCTFDYKNIPIGQNAQVRGNIIRKDVNKEGYTYKLSDVSLNEQPFSKYVFLKCPDEYFIGDTISAPATLSAPLPPLYKNGFDDKTYCMSQGVYLRAYSWSSQKTGEFTGVLPFFSDINTKLQKRADRLFGAQSGIVKALLLGYSEDMSEQVAQAFRDAGVAHVLVVSGLHISILWGSIYFLLRKLRLNRTFIYVFCMLIILLYMCITCFSVPVVRASIMAIVLLTSRHFGERYDALTSLGLAAIILMLINPLGVLSVGLQMSFISVYAIACLAPFIARKIKSQAAAITIAATLGVSGISINAFNHFSVIGLLVNLVVVPLTFLGVVTAAIALVASYIVFALGKLIADLSGVIYKLMQSIAVFASGILNISLPTLGSIFTLCILAAIFICSPYVKYKLRAKSMLVGVLCVIMSISLAINFSPHCYITFLPGNAAVIEVYGKKITIDTGKNLNAQGYAIKNGGYEFSLITHIDQNHMGNAQSLLEQGYTKRLITNEYDAPYFGQADTVRAGDIIDLSNDMQLKILSPTQAPGKNPNDSAIVCLLTYHDKNICLFTSDATLRTQKNVLEEIGTVPIVQLSSHASEKQTDGSLIEQLCPKYVVASTPKDYSHKFEYIHCPMLYTQTSVVFEISAEKTILIE